MESTATRTKVYRHFDKDGALLYVGVSLNAVVRLSQHKRVSHWFDEIHNITIESFETRKQALDAETKAIQEEKPKYNIQKTAARLPVKLQEIVDESKTELQNRVIKFGILYTPTEAAHHLEISTRVMKSLVETKKIGTIKIPAIPGLTAHGNPYKEKIMITGWQLIEYLEHLMEKNK